MDQQQALTSLLNALGNSDTEVVMEDTPVGRKFGIDQGGVSPESELTPVLGHLDGKIFSSVEAVDAGNYDEVSVDEEAYEEFAELCSRAIEDVSASEVEERLSASSTGN